MKINKNLIATACLAAMSVGSILSFNNTYAASSSITINNDAESLYVETGTKASADGTATYDSATKTLTLNNFHGDDIYVQELDQLTISLKGKNTLTMDTYVSLNAAYRALSASKTALKITGTGSLSIDKDIGSKGGVPVSAAAIDIDSVTLNINVPNAYECLRANTTTSIIGIVEGVQTSPIKIESGNLTFSCKSAAESKSLIINGGNIIVNGNLSDVVDPIENIEINGGTTSVNNGYVLLTGNLRINGGTLNIHPAFGAGISLEQRALASHEVGSIKITGGNLNIDNVSDGIQLDNATADSYIEFSGGTTKITAKENAVSISFKDNSEHSKHIIIKDNMYLLPKDTNIMTSTLFKGWYFIKSKDKEIIITDDKTLLPKEDTTEEEKPEVIVDTSKEEPEAKTEKAEVKAPDTGVFSEDSSKAIIVTISVSLVAIISGIAILSYVGKRVMGRVKFDR